MAKERKKNPTKRYETQPGIKSNQIKSKIKWVEWVKWVE